MDFIGQPGQKILMLWSSIIPVEIMQSTVTSLQEQVGVNGKVALENAERLRLSQHAHSSFDVVLSGTLPPSSIIHENDLLEEIIKIIKPNGILIMREAVADEIGPKLRTPAKVLSSLTLAGFINISETKPVVLKKTEYSDLKKVLNVDSDLSVVEVQSQKPNFEVGAASLLPFAKIPTKVPDPSVAAVWSLSAVDTIDDDVDIIDSDMLLDEDDLKKPDPSTLRVCGSTGKKKACKNCTCGLAEELQSEKGGGSQKTFTATSACGNCYLGDAFRCASCPYLGMPAFKPGEKIQLTDRQLKADA